MTYQNLANLEPVGEFVLLQPCGQFQTKTPSGIYLPETTGMLAEFVVAGVGAKAAEKLGDALKLGAHVLAHAEDGLEVAGYRLLRSTQIFAIVHKGIV